VFVDFNQNAKDRTIASVYSVRANPEARVSCPLRWDEVADVEPEELTLATVPRRYKKLGDVWGEMDARAFTLDSLLELSERQKAEGLGEAPFPPHFEKQKDEPLRAPPREGTLRAKPALAARAKRQPRRGGSR